MQVKQYFVKKATTAGNPFTTTHGSELQPYFIDLEGYTGKTVMLNRLVGKAAPSGPVWATLVETQKKNGKGTYYKMTLAKAPEGAPAGQMAMPTSAGVSDDQFNLLVALTVSPMFPAWQERVKWAMDNKDTVATLLTVPEDKPEPQKDIVLDDIPFDDPFGPGSDFDRAISGDVQDDLP